MLWIYFYKCLIKINSMQKFNACVGCYFIFILTNDGNSCAKFCLPCGSPCPASLLYNTCIPLYNSSHQINPYSTEIFLYKPWRPKGILNWKSSSISSFEYLCDGSASINFFYFFQCEIVGIWRLNLIPVLKVLTLTARGSTLDVRLSTLDVRFWRLNSIPALEE